MSLVITLVFCLANEPLIAPYNNQLLAYLTRVSSSMIESSSPISLSAKEFDILLSLSGKQMNRDKIEQLCSIFVRLLRQNILSKKKKKLANKAPGQDLNLSILKVLQNLVPSVDKPIDKYLPSLPILCCKIVQRDQRIEFMRLFQAFVDQSTEAESNTVWFLQNLVELNAWNADQIEEPDYERRLNSYKRLTDRLTGLTDLDPNGQEYLCVFYHCLYELQHSVNDLSLREYASQCIHLFLQRIPAYQTYFLTETRAILKQPGISSSIRHEFLRHLAFIVDLNVDHEDLLDLKRLRNHNDVELDFFNNITHVQNHRRLRALKRLKLIHTEQPFRVTTISNYLLPIVCSFINDSLSEDGQEINDDIVFTCLTALSQVLPWGKYNSLFVSFFRQLTTTKRTLNLSQKRCLTKTVSAIIDAFHFDLNTSENNKSEGQFRQSRCDLRLSHLLS